ncbi:hypothetical protein QE410_000564 [Microbacterium sp. SORGH_AS 1204]|nr:hypothetical protein [Microbacterium sp. SORGH_AS_1204]
MTSQATTITTLLTQTMLYMAGSVTLEQAAHITNVEPCVISELSSEYASYMLPRAARALRSYMP